MCARLTDLMTLTQPGVCSSEHLFGLQCCVVIESSAAFFVCVVHVRTIAS